MKLARILTSAVALLILTTSAAAAATITVTSTDVPKSIPDANNAGITSTLLGADLFNLTDINLIFNDLQHTSVSDLHIELRSPGGTTVVLMKSGPENGILVGLGVPQNFVGTVFDDQAATNLRDGSAPFTGSFNVNHASVVGHPLSLFNGQDASGLWTLFVSDRAGLYSGQLNQWSLQFTGTDAIAAVPEPATMGLLGTGLLGIAARARRRRTTAR